jgi:chromosome segregation ATPase
MTMATDGVEAFLRAEEEAHRLVDELGRLKQESESYKTARETLDGAAEGVSGLAAQLADLAGQLGGVVQTLRLIGTPELLRAQEAVTSEVAALRQDLDGTQRSITDHIANAMEQVRVMCTTLEAAERARQEELQRLQGGMDALATKEDLGARLAAVNATVGTARNLALGTVGISLVTLVLVAWVALSLGRG